MINIIFVAHLDILLQTQKFIFKHNYNSKMIMSRWLLGSKKG